MTRSMSILALSTTTAVFVSLVLGSAPAAGAVEPGDDMVTSVADAAAALETLGLIELPDEAESVPLEGDLGEGLSVTTREGTTSIVPERVEDAVEINPDATVFPSADLSFSTAVTRKGEYALSNAAYVVITDESAPGSYRFELEVDEEPAALRLEGGVVLVENAAGEVVNFIDSPWAIDNAGSQLPTWYEIDKNAIVQHIDLEGAEYPVVADPKMACDLINCTLEYNKVETRDVASTSSLASYLVGAACTAFGTAIAGFVCAAITAWFIDTANSAQNQKKCVGIRAMRIPGPQSAPYPVVYSGGNCK